MKRRGIANLGNTCSINALLQCFAHCKAIRTFFTEASIKIAYTGKYSVTHELVKVLRQLWGDTAEDVVVPKALLLALYEKHAATIHHGEQHDICEVCTLLCDKIAEECFQCSALKAYDVPNAPKIVAAANQAMKRHNAKNASQWLDMIQGVTLTMVQCRNKACAEAYFNFEPFIVLPLNIPRKTSTLQDCLDATFKNEVLDDWCCDKCKCRGGLKVTRLWKMPHVFCMNLNRFAYDPHTNNMRKNNVHIDVPARISLTPDSVLGPQHDNQAIDYALCSVALHHGSTIWGGHYTAIGATDPTWMHYDDTSMDEVPHPNVAEVYLMMYERV